jgi:hypothetical protein
MGKIDIRIYMTGYFPGLVQALQWHEAGLNQYCGSKALTLEKWYGHDVTRAIGDTLTK